MGGRYERNPKESKSCVLKFLEKWISSKKRKRKQENKRVTASCGGTKAKIKKEKHLEGVKRHNT